MNKKEEKKKAKTVGEVYDVEKILGKKIENGKKFYLVKWENYPESKNTWEKASNILSIDLIDDFENAERNKLKRKFSDEDEADAIVPKRKKHNVSSISFN